MSDKIKKLLLFLSEDSEDAKKNKSKLEVKLNEDDFGKEKEIFVYYDFVKDGEKRKKLTSIKVKIPKKDDIPNPEPDELDAIVGQKEFVIDNTNQDVTITLNGQDSEGEITSYIWKSVVIEGQPTIPIVDNQQAVATAIIPKGLEFTRIAFQLVVSDKFANTDTEIVEVRPKLESEPEPTECPPGQHKDENGNCVPDVVPEPTTGYPVQFTEYYNSKNTINATKDGIYETGKYIDEIILSSGASGVDSHQIKNGWLIINSGGGNGRVYWDFHRTNNKAVEQLPNFGHKFAFYGTFKMGGENLSIKFGNHGSDGREYDGQYIFGGLGLSFHATEAQSKVEYWHNVQGDEEQFSYPNGLKIETGKEYKYFLVINTNFDKQEVSLKAWLDFGNGNGWTNVIQNRVWNKSKWNPPSNPPQGKDRDDVMAGPIIKCHTIWTRANGGNSQIKDVGWGMPI